MRLNIYEIRRVKILHPEKKKGTLKYFNEIIQSFLAAAATTTVELFNEESTTCCLSKLQGEHTRYSFVKCSNQEVMMHFCEIYLLTLVNEVNY